MILTTATIALAVGIIFGGISGAVTGAFSIKYIIPWAERNLNLVLGGENSADSGPGSLILAEDSATVSTVEAASPAVVSIIISKKVSVSSATGEDIFPFDFFGFEWPGITVPEDSGENAEPVEQEIGGGTGFIVTPDGLIVTNRHVVSDEEAKYSIVMNDGAKYDAKVQAMDTFFDIAVLKIDAVNLPTLEFGDSDNLKIGQTVIAIGNALSEYSNTVTKGVISGINRRVVAGDNFGQSEVIEEAIQTDAAINPGNSGGPLLDLAGRVIGVNTAVSQRGQLVGFAIPANSVKKIVESVKINGRIVRPWLGVRYVIVDSEMAKENNLAFDYGALVVRGENETEIAIVPGSPADKAGIVENDIILEIDGQRIDEDNTLARLIAKYNPGDEIKLKISHKGEEKEVIVTLEEYKQENNQ